jgi:hypothetical protein
MAAEPLRTGSTRRDVGVEELLQKLQLSEVEREGVVLRKEESENLPSIKWMAAMKLLTTRNFSKASLVNTIRSAVELSKDEGAPAWSTVGINELPKLELSRIGQHRDSVTDWAMPRQ